MQQVICNVPFRDEFIVRWRFQSRNTLFRKATKLLWRKILRRRGQRKVRLSESRPTVVTLFHLFPVGAKKKSNIFSELIHPLLKLPNCVLKQQQHILQLSEGLGSVFSLFKELALSAYCHFHSFLIFQKFRSQVQTKVTRAILSRNQSAGVSNLQRGRSCE